MCPENSRVASDAGSQNSDATDTVASRIEIRFLLDCGKDAALRATRQDTKLVFRPTSMFGDHQSSSRGMTQQIRQTLSRPGCRQEIRIFSRGYKYKALDSFAWKYLRRNPNNEKWNIPVAENRQPHPILRVCRRRRAKLVVRTKLHRLLSRCCRCEGRETGDDSQCKFGSQSHWPLLTGMPSLTIVEYTARRSRVLAVQVSFMFSASCPFPSSSTLKYRDES